MQDKKLETMIDINDEVSKLPKEAKELLKFLLDRYIRNDEFEFDKGSEVAGLPKGDVDIACGQLINSGFAYGSSARPNSID